MECVASPFVVIDSVFFTMHNPQQPPTPQPTQQLKQVLAFNRALGTLANDPDLIKGLNQVAVMGTRYEEAATRADLKELLRIYLEETLAKDGAFTDSLEADVKDLAFVMGLSSKEVEAVRGEVVSKMYRKLLRQEVQSGRLEAAESPATVLQMLCDKVHYAPQQAAELHRGLYRQKLESMLEKNKLTGMVGGCGCGCGCVKCGAWCCGCVGVLYTIRSWSCQGTPCNATYTHVLLFTYTHHTHHTEEDQEELAKLRKLLCIPKADRDLVHLELCGKIYRTVVEAAVSTGIDGFDSDERQKVGGGVWCGVCVCVVVCWCSLVHYVCSGIVNKFDNQHTLFPYITLHTPPSPYLPPLHSTTRFARHSRTSPSPTKRHWRSWVKWVDRHSWALCAVRAHRPTDWSLPRS